MIQPSNPVRYAVAAVLLLAFPACRGRVAGEPGATTVRLVFDGSRGRRLSRCRARRRSKRLGSIPSATWSARSAGTTDRSAVSTSRSGRLLERLREPGLEERTLVAFTSDHGEEFLEHGAHFHGQSVYGELTHVPFVLYWPGTLPAGLVIEEGRCRRDVMPTLLELAFDRRSHRPAGPVAPLG